ncbi:MAG: adenine methyltransferase [Lachnospiraceae bacterium]|nr:adenine methyltransferase [Lachnospiraceae bacterium]
MNDVLFSSKSDEWSTPQHTYDELNNEFHFTLDPCATEENKKCDKYYSEGKNGLLQDWNGETVFCNPPYSQIATWVKKCHDEGNKPNTVVVMLIPARTDTRYFQNEILNRAELRFIAGRLKFGDSKSSAPFPSMVVVFRGAKRK